MINILGNIIVFGSVAFLIGKVVWQESEFFAPWKGWIKELLRQCWKKRLRIIYLIFAVVIGLSLLYVFGLVSLEIINIDWKKVKSGESGIRNLGIAFLGTVSGFGALFGVYLAILRSEENKRQNDTAEQGLITDRISRATEGMGQINTNDAPIIEVRVGAIHSLERIAQDSLRDHIKIIEILCAYVRYNSPKDDGGKERGHLREDLQTAITIIGRRETWQDGKKYLEKEIKEKYRIDLCKCNLCRADFADANLSNASLIGSDLRGASFISAELSYAWLDSANFEGATLYKAYAHETDFSKCENLTQEQLDVMFCGIEVKIPDDLSRPAHWPIDDLEEYEFMDAYWEWIKENPLLSA